ncbi:uncharacterized protein LOC122079010 [Macadamia integrifolia]|uniref:uncharacterized protein LOC122079010 n=1 Tax=Macadamia integrifolia TaxID=60698 RepID=UPI001C4ECE28|nr:uncharacterized protein LOC122079010 [Macadamia integrifolia]
MDMEKEEEEEVYHLRMNSKYEKELIHRAIQEFIEEKRAQRNKASGDCFVGNDEQALLSRLISQLEALKEDATIESPKPASEMDVLSAASEEEAKDENVGRLKVGSTEMGQEAILKELQNVKRQNSITHWLLSTLIFVTVAWQLSEVKLIINVKNKVSHPFRSVGSVIKGMLGEGKDENDESTNLDQAQSSSLGGLKMPKLDIESDIE